MRPSLTVIGEVTDYLIVVEITLIMRIWQTNNKLYQSFTTELRLSTEYSTGYIDKVRIRSRDGVVPDDHTETLRADW